MRDKGRGMSVRAFEGIVENGRIRLEADVDLPEHTRVHVILPNTEPPAQPHIYSPRLARQELSADFAKEVAEDSPDASV